MKKEKLFFLLFLASSLVEIFVPYSVEIIHLISKPLVLISLIGYYLSGVLKRKQWFVVGMVACCLGDILLLFVKQDEIFFKLGLVAFLGAQILYSVSYRQSRNTVGSDSLTNVQKARMSFPVALAGTGLVVFLYPTLGELKLPVVIYSMILILMVLSAISRLGRTSSRSFWFVFGGAALFMISDSMLAINKFFAPLPFGSVLVMGTYCMAQGLIVTGMIRHEEAKFL